MKRQRQLIEKIADIENLQLAYYKAQKGKVAKFEVFKYGKRLRENLRKLQREILSGCIETGKYSYFTIFDPKKRLICAAPFEQRVLHHAIMNVCHPLFEKAQIFDSYASRKNKGTYAALYRAKHFNKRYKWFLKLDFYKYFDSLDHTVLERQLSRLFKDKQLLNIFTNIIYSYCVIHDKGVPIGNLTSQYFANHYLSRADHYVKEIVKIPAYVRFMDDIVMWHNDKRELIRAGLSLKQYSDSYLKLTLKPFCLNRNTYGLPFLGYLLYPDDIRLAHRSRTRFVKKLRKYDNNLKSGKWLQCEYQNHVSPLIAFTEYANAKEFRKKTMRNLSCGF